MVGARDCNFSGLERLTQRIEYLAGKLRQLVEKKNAIVGKRDFTRPCPQAAADKRRH